MYGGNSSPSNGVSTALVIDILLKKKAVKQITFSSYRVYLSNILFTCISKLYIFFFKLQTIPNQTSCKKTKPKKKYKITSSC